jgi:hypothetical protein
MRIRGFPVTHSRLSHKLSALAHKRNLRPYAALKRRSSTVPHAFVSFSPASKTRALAELLVRSEFSTTAEAVPFPNPILPEPIYEMTPLLSGY